MGDAAPSGIGPVMPAAARRHERLAAAAAALDRPRRAAGVQPRAGAAGLRRRRAARSATNPGRCWRCWSRARSAAASASSYTLYYATTFVFTGLAVAVAFHGGLFNIGGEGQAMLGGLGAGAGRAGARPTAAGAGAAAADGAGRRWPSAWPGPRCPAALQAWRGSHVVITTIMFNFIASALLVYLLRQRAEGAGQHVGREPRLRRRRARCRACTRCSPRIGIEWPRSPLNPACCWRLAARRWCTCCCGARAPATRCAPSAIAPEAARYAGIRAARADHGRRWRCRARWPGWSASTRSPACTAGCCSTSSPAPASPASRCR